MYCQIAPYQVLLKSFMSRTAEIYSRFEFTACVFMFCAFTNPVSLLELFLYISHYYLQLLPIRSSHSHYPYPSPRSTSRLIRKVFHNGNDQPAPQRPQVPSPTDAIFLRRTSWRNPSQHCKLDDRLSIPLRSPLHWSNAWPMDGASHGRGSTNDRAGP